VLPHFVAEMSVEALEEKEASPRKLLHCFGDWSLLHFGSFFKCLMAFNFDVFLSMIPSRWEFDLLLDRWFLLSFWECACLRWILFSGINLVVQNSLLKCR